MAKKYPSFTTPVGTFVFPQLHAPDTKFKAEGEWNTKVRFDGDAAVDMAARLDEACDAAQEAGAQELIEKGKAKTLAAARKMLPTRKEPYTKELDEETGEETGAILVNFKLKASGTRNDGTTWTAKPRLFDSQGQPIPLGLKIGSGTRGKINYGLRNYCTPVAGTGVSCRLNAAQIIQLQTWGGMTAEQAGFEAVEGGFSAADADGDMFAGQVDRPAAATSEEYDDGEDAGAEGDF